MQHGKRTIHIYVNFRPNNLEYYQIEVSSKKPMQRPLRQETDKKKRVKTELTF